MDINTQAARRLDEVADHFGCTRCKSVPDSSNSTGSASPRIRSNIGSRPMLMMSRIAMARARSNRRGPNGGMSLEMVGCLEYDSKRIGTGVNVERRLDGAPVR